VDYHSTKETLSAEYTIQQNKHCLLSTLFNKSADPTIQQKKLSLLIPPFNKRNTVG